MLKRDKLVFIELSLQFSAFCQINNYIKLRRLYYLRTGNDLTLEHNHCCPKKSLSKRKLVSTSNLEEISTELKCASHLLYMYMH